MAESKPIQFNGYVSSTDQGFSSNISPKAGTRYGKATENLMGFDMWTEYCATKAEAKALATEYIEKIFGDVEYEIEWETI